MDFADITNSFKKQAKKATDLALKPVKMVTDPLAKANQNMTHMLFGPDLDLFTKLHEYEKRRLFELAYKHHVERMTKRLKDKKLSAPKITGVNHAYVLIAAAPHEELSVDQQIDHMEELFDELRSACKYGTPTKLQGDTFETDKKHKFGSSDLEIVYHELSRTKSFLRGLDKQLDRDMIYLLLDNHPDALSCLTKTKELTKSLESQRKTYQQSYTHTWDAILNGQGLIRDIAHEGEKLRKMKPKENSLFAPEKTKIKQSEQDVMKTLQHLCKTNFPKRIKTVQQKKSVLEKDKKMLDSMYSSTPNVRTSFHASWYNWHHELSNHATAGTKSYQSTLKKLSTTHESKNKQLETTTHDLSKKIKRPYTDLALYEKPIQSLDVLIQGLTTCSLDMADHTWMTGVHHELCMLSNQRCADQREQFLLLYLTLIRQHVLFFKLYKRLLQSMLQTVKGYREKLDTYNVYAKDLFSSLLKDLDTLIAWLQEEHKAFEKTITVEEKQLSTRKAELRDTINFKRLTYFKRQYIDTLITSTVAKEEGMLLHDRIESFIILTKG